MNLDQYKAELLKNPEIQMEYDSLTPEYDLMRQIIQARIDQNMTQKQLAEKVGTKQSVLLGSKVETTILPTTFYKKLQRP